MTTALKNIIEMNKENNFINPAVIAGFTRPICRKRMIDRSMAEFDDCWKDAVASVEKAFSGDFSGFSKDELEIFETLVGFYYDGIFEGHLLAEKISKYWE